jgi:DNA-binding response OmpR family regulator
MLRWFLVMERPSDSPFRILCVEDDDDIRELVSGHLRTLGHDVTEADSAELGLALLGDQHFGLVLSDYHLPGKSGTWMLGEAEARGLLHDTSVLLLTAAVHVENGGGWTRLQKPVDMKTLDVAVSSASAAVHPEARGAAAPGTPRDLDESGVHATGSRVELVLYVHGGSPLSRRYESELGEALAAYPPEGFRLRVVDVATSEGAELARENAVVFVPTLVRRSPGPTCRLVGQLQRRGSLDRLLVSAGLEKA